LYLKGTNQFETKYANACLYLLEFLACDITSSETLIYHSSQNSMCVNVLKYTVVLSGVGCNVKIKCINTVSNANSYYFLRFCAHLKYLVGSHQKCVSAHKIKTLYKFTRSTNLKRAPWCGKPLTCLHFHPHHHIFLAKCEWVRCTRRKVANVYAYNLFIVCAFIGTF
jgi:hypothetical protein